MTIRNRKTFKRLGLAVFLSFIAMVVFPIAVATASCTATPNYDADGNYTGCTTNADGDEQTSTPEGITEAGCGTFCDYVPIGETVDEPAGESGEEPDGKSGDEPDGETGDDPVEDEPADSGPGPDDPGDPFWKWYFRFHSDEDLS